MSKPSSASRNRLRDRVVRTHVQSKTSPLGCVTWMAIPALCFSLFLLVTVIHGASTSNASNALAQKQQILQQELNEGRAHAQAQAGPDTPVPTAQTPQPRRAGIINSRQAPFPPSIFTVNNAWQGPVGSQWINAYAGAQTNPDDTPGRGGLVLYTDGDFALSYLGTFLAPAGTPALTINKVQGDMLLLQTASGQAFAFNLQSHQYSL
jgi:hypothetical protein